MPWNDKNLRFLFETNYRPYEKLVFGGLPPADLVIEDSGRKTHRQKLELKLTAMPDEATKDQSDERQGAELVIRSQSIVYLALSISDYYKRERQKLATLLSPVCSKIRNWSVKNEVAPHLPEMAQVVREIQLRHHSSQQPFLLQPVWKTEGQSPKLAENCLDAFVWSNLAFISLFADRALDSRNEITRPARSLVWLLKMLYDFAEHGSFDPGKVLQEITYKAQTDKAFSASGAITNRYMKCDELERPRICRSSLKEIFVGDPRRILKPERRLDMVLYFSDDIF
jgi:hypothetical protein